MTAVARAKELARTGRIPQVLGRELQAGRLVRVRHGAYADALDIDAVAQHRQLIAGTWPILGADTVLSHTSAGVLHGLPTWAEPLSLVTVVRPGPGHGSRRTSLHARVAVLPPGDVVAVEDYRMTSIERTVADLACVLGYDRAVAVVDAALHAGVSREGISSHVAASGRRRGVATARAALALADGRSESVGESMSRVRMSDVGLPAPDLQVKVFDDFGNHIARSDFGWVLRGVLGEFDGKVKYIGSTEAVARAVMNEKSREEALRELGWMVVRWGWADLKNPPAFRRRIEAAFEQANPAKIHGHYALTPAI